jgi:hypothetical protein
MIYDCFIGAPLTTTGATSEAGNTYRSGAPEFIPGY